MENSQTHSNFQNWKVNFKTEMCANSVFLQITDQRSQDSKINRRSFDIARRDFPEFEMLDAKIASALQKILTSVHFRRRVSVEEKRAQKDDRFSRKTQIVCISYEYFRATGVHEAVQGLSDVQDSDTRWDQALLGASEKKNHGNGPGRFDMTSQKCMILFGFRVCLV